MKKILFCIFLIATVMVSKAQTNRQQLDSVSQLIRTYFNEQNADSLYALTGKDFQQSLNAEKFRTIANNNLFPLGQIRELQYADGAARAARYKAVFDNITLAMIISLDDKGKLGGFLFKEFKNEDRKTTAVTSSNNMLTAMDSAVDRAVKPYTLLAATTGLSLAVYANGKTVYYNYGTMEKGKNELPTENTLYEIGSVTKTFTAILLANAVNNHKIQLNDPVYKYLPALQNLVYNGQPVTVQMLSNHASGLPRMPDNFDAFVKDTNNPYRYYDENAMMAYLKNFKLAVRPGTKYDYSNLGVALLGLILQKVNKMPFEKMVMEKICKPLGLKDTRQFLLKTDTARFAKGYDEMGRYTGQWDLNSMAPAGGLRSTTADMMHYLLANFSATGAIKKDMDLARKITFNDGPNKIALGWHYITPVSTELLFHNGETGGYMSQVLAEPKGKFALVVLSNTAIGTEGVTKSLVKWLEQQ